MTAASRLRSSSMVLARLPDSAPSSASPARVATRALGRPVNSATSVEPKQPTTRYPTPQLTPAIQRFAGSGWASRPVQMAAVMAAGLIACEPNGASSAETAPVVPHTTRSSGRYPSACSTAMPGAYCPARVATSRGTPIPMSAPVENAGIVRCGTASPAPERSACSPPRRPVTARPTARAHTTAYVGTKRRASRNATSMAPASSGAERNDVKIAVPKENRIPASIAETTPAGMRARIRANMPVAVSTVAATPATRKAPTASA